MKKNIKKFLKSRTLWVNFVAFVLLIIQGFTGFVFDPSTQAVFLVIINFGLRLITKEEIVWK